MTKPTDTLTRLAHIAATGRRPRIPRRARPDPTTAAREAEAFVARIDDAPEPQAVPPTQWARHATHGIGEVLSTMGEGQDRKYSIDFADEVHTVAAESVELLFAPKPAARHEPGGLGLAIIQAATRRARRSPPHHSGT